MLPIPNWNAALADFHILKVFVKDMFINGVKYKSRIATAI
jgi:hypothetical protein